MTGHESCAEAQPATVGVLTYAVLRAPLWPIETLEPFAAPELAAAAKAVNRAAALVDERRAEVASRLEAAIPHIEDRAARGYALAVRRVVHRGTDVLPSPDGHLRHGLSLAPAAAELVDDEATARRALATATDAFARQHAAEVERQRAALRAVTSDDRFRCALVLANPEVAQRWARYLSRRASSEEQEKARHRRLEATVFHYLMRAVGRATPTGCWSGVTPVTPCADGRRPGLAVTAAPARFHVSPDLRPFAAVVDGLARRPPYRHFTAHRRHAAFRAAEAGLSPFGEAILSAYGDGRAHPPDSVVSALGSALGRDASVVERLERAVEELIDRGALISDLRLPRMAPDAWTALDAVTPLLVDAHRGPWADALLAVRDQCERLARGLEDEDPDGVGAAREAVGCEVAALGRRVGVDAPQLDEVVRVDVRLGFEVTWDRATIDGVGTAVAHGLDFYASDGAAEAFRKASVDEVASALSPNPTIGALLGSGVAAAGRPPTPPALADSLEGAFWAYRSIDGVRSAVARATEHWHQRLDGAWNAPVWAWEPPADGPGPARPGPAGALLLTVSGPGSFRIEWGRPQPGIFTLRQAEALRQADGQSRSIDALRDLFDRWRRQGVMAAEVVGADSPSPNTALGPQVTPVVLDAHGEPGIADIVLHLDAARRPWLRRADGQDLMVPVYNSASFVGLTDPCSRLLLRLAMGHGWELLSGGFLTLPAERCGSHHLPRIPLPDGTVVAGERWTITGPTLAELQQAAPAPQYLLWRAIADRLGLPELVWARLEPSPNAPSLLVRTDSPLAVRCLFGRLAAGVERLVLTEPPGDPAGWPVKDGDGKTYLAELAVTWYDDRYWDATLAGAAAEGP